MNERDRFFLDAPDLHYGDKALKEAEELVEGIIRSVSPLLVAPILSFSVGGISFAWSFAKKGFAVTAWELLNAAKLEGKHNVYSKDLNLNWVDEDGLALEKHTFNHIFALGYSFGLFKEEQVNRMHLAKFFHLLTPGGILVLQLIGRDILEKYFHPKYWIEKEAGVYLLNERNIDYNTGLLTENYTLIQNSEIKKYQFNMKTYYPDEISQMLEICGFKSIKIFGGVDQRKYDDHSSCLLVVAEKPYSTSFIKC